MSQALENFHRRRVCLHHHCWSSARWCASLSTVLSASSFRNLLLETYDLIDLFEKRYGIRVERVFSPLTPEEQEQVHGPALWSRDPDRCCNLRKVEPLRNKLKELRAWITAIRRDQTVARGSARK